MLAEGLDGLRKREQSERKEGTDSKIRSHAMLPSAKCRAQCIMKRLMNEGYKYGMKMNASKTKIMRISMKLSKEYRYEK